MNPPNNIVAGLHSSAPVVTRMHSLFSSAQQIVRSQHETCSWCQPERKVSLGSLGFFGVNTDCGSFVHG